jgi:hypothetical protein
MNRLYWVLIIVIILLSTYTYISYRTLLNPRSKLSTQNSENLFNLYDDRLVKLHESREILFNWFTNNNNQLSDFQTTEFSNLDKLLIDYDDAVNEWNFNSDSLNWIREYNVCVYDFQQCSKIITKLARDTIR